MWEELTKRRPDDAYAWMMAYRRLRGAPLKHLPMMMAIARDSSPFVVIQKGSQIGISELVVSMALWTAATQFAGRGNVLLLHPTQTLMDDFTKTRIDTAIQDSPRIRQLMQPEPPKRKGADSLRVKRIGDGHLALRGSDSRRQIQSYDADWVFLDEADQMAEDIFQLAQRRLGSSANGRLWAVSTPGMAEAGINYWFRQSDQHRYHIPCPACGLKQALTFEANVDLDSGLRVCRECRAELALFAVGEWIPDAPGNRIRGYHISRLYAPWANIPDLIEASTATTPAALQQFHNSDLGETYSPPGGGLSPDELDRCRRNYSLGDYRGQRCDMGVDVGLQLHVVIREHPEDPRGERRLWFAGQVSWPELAALMERFHVLQCVIDAQPELNLAKEFAVRHRATTWTAYYSRQQAGMHQQKGTAAEPNVVHLNRTESLDAVAQQVRTQLAALPRDARQLGGRFKAREGYGEYYRELLASERRIEADANGQLVARWDHRRRDDHYAHAEGYCRVASQSSIGGRPLSVRTFGGRSDPRRGQGWPSWAFPPGF